MPLASCACALSHSLTPGCAVCDLVRADGGHRPHALWRERWGRGDAVPRGVAPAPEGLADREPVGHETDAGDAPVWGIVLVPAVCLYGLAAAVSLSRWRYVASVGSSEL